jgi:hypothetical protein
MTDICPENCSCHGTAEDWGQELLEALRDVESQRVRDNIIAWHTADQLACPFCHVGPGQACVTFPRARNATFTHMKRVNARLAQVTENRAKARN